MTLDEVCRKIDWDLLATQKIRLLDVIENLSTSEFARTEQGPAHLEALEGLVCLLDELQDAAEEEELWLNNFVSEDL